LKRASNYSLSLYLLLGLSVLFLSACGNEVNVSLAQNGKIVLHPRYGDLIRWEPGLQVHFLLPFCKETDVWINECHVNVNSTEQFGQYNYICKGSVCSDPEVDVGKSTRTRPAGVATMRQFTPANFQVILPCQNGTITPVPSDVPGDLYDQPVTPGKVVQWLSNGSGAVLLSDWTVTFDAGNTNVCNESDIHNADGFQICTIKTGLPAGVYRYTSTSNHCQPGYGTVTLK